jgi:cell division protein FtsN
MARRKTRKRKTRRAKKATTPGWVWMLFGLAVGLSVAVAIYVKDRQPSEGIVDTRSAAPTKPKRASKGKLQEPASSSRYAFYDMLPNFEVVIPEEDVDARPDVKPDPVTAPGIYVLQAGSFSSYADADRAKAQLALLGVVARIQKISIDDKTYHRVRVGPFDSLEQLNANRLQLREASIDVLVIKVGE